MLSGLDAHRHLAARSAPAKRQTWPCRRLSSCHPFPAPQAHGAAQSGLSRSTLPPPSLRHGVRPLARRSRRATSLPHHGRDSRARVRPLLRGRTRPRVASGSRRRRPSRPRCADRTLPAKGRRIARRRRHAAIPRHLRSDRDKRWRSGMKATDKIDAARVDLLLGELRLPGIKLIWAALATTADKEGWPAARFLAALAEQEIVERNRRRFERHLEEARLPPGKTLDAFDFAAVPMISKAQVHALAAATPGSKRGQSPVLRAARRRKIPSRGRDRPGPGR